MLSRVVRTVSPLTAKLHRKPLLYKELVTSPIKSVVKAKARSNSFLIRKAGVHRKDDFERRNKTREIIISRAKITRAGAEIALRAASTHGLNRTNGLKSPMSQGNLGAIIPEVVMTVDAAETHAIVVAREAICLEIARIRPVVEDCVDNTLDAKTKLRTAMVRVYDSASRETGRR
jgi:hypothetical protein